MAERDPVEVIREQLNGAEGLAGLHSEHETFKHWHSETKMILDKIFTAKSVHYQGFLALRFREVTVKAFASPEIDRINAQRYKRDLENAKNILQGAIKELTLDRTLFKKIQTTPKSVEVSLRGEYFVSSGIEDTELLQALERAFEGSGLSALRGCETIQKQESFDSRIDQIKRARLGIYDLSDSGNREVFLELGIALGLGKKVVIICRQGSPIPDMVKPLDPVAYEDLRSLSEKLKQRIKL
jgi:hypothetical protein